MPEAPGMKTSDPQVPTPGPATVVDCPWCAAPVELRIDDDAMTCRACRVAVEIVSSARTSVDGSLAPAA